jgi:hypothetical protein
VLLHLMAGSKEESETVTLLKTGLDWVGPNEAWERQSSQLLGKR